MAKRHNEPIRVRAFVTVNGKEVDVDTLSPEMQRKLATQLKLKYLNALFRGQAVFSVCPEVGEKGEGHETNVG